jgi:hypothetical protein
MTTNQGEFITLPRKLRSPGKAKDFISSIRNRITIEAKPARSPIIIATITISVCSVILAFSIKAYVFDEIRVERFSKKPGFTDMQLFFSLY